MNTPAWVLCCTGIVFCLSGAFLFYRNVFEKDRRIAPSIIVMIMGVILIAIGTAKYFYLFK